VDGVDAVGAPEGLADPVEHGAARYRVEGFLGVAVEACSPTAAQEDCVHKCLISFLILLSITLPP
jgi:hypothetical protein